MSYRETAEDFNKLVGKLANLITDTFKCCIKNYEAILPYLGKRETNSKVHHKLVQVNILLNKLCEELVGIKVEYVADSPCEQREETVQSERGRKRRLSDAPELGRDETKSMKIEVPFSNCTKCSIELTSETGIDIQSENLVLNSTEETSNTQLQKLDIQGTKIIKMGIQDSNELEDTNKSSITNNKIPVAQKSLDNTNNEIIVCFADDEVKASVADILVEDNPYDKSADTTTQRETNKVGVKLLSLKSEVSGEEKCQDISNALCKDQDIPRRVQKKVGCPTSASNQAKRSFQNNSVECELGLYGIKKHKKKSYKCTLCNCVTGDSKTLHAHVNGKKHQKKLLSANIGFSKMSEVPNNCTSTTISVCSVVPCSFADTVQSESVESDSECSAVSCSLANTVAIVEDRHQLISGKRVVRLDDIWTYFHPPFHINKKYIRFHSGKIICYLCYEEVGRYILSVRKHIARSSHLDRINILRNIELENKSSNKQLLDIPGFLKNVIPATQFSSRNCDFFCDVCNCFCENTVVLNHMTGESHGKKVDEMKKSE